MRWRSLPVATTAMAATAAAFALVGRSTAAITLLALAIVRAHLVLLPTVDRALDRAVASAAHRVSSAVATTMFSVIGTAFVVPLNLVARLRKHDPVRADDQPTGWRTVGSAATAPPPGAPLDRMRRPRSGWLRPAAAGVAVLAIAATVSVIGHDRAPGGADAAIAPALADQPEVAAMQAEEGTVFSSLEPDADLGWRLPDRAGGDLVGVVDGRRRTIGSVPRSPVVWFFGGSALWGSGQRDDHTIPSQLAAIAARHGTPIQAVNWGVFAYTSGQEVASFERALRELPAPDLVVFYDGYNDISVGSGAVLEGYPSGSEVMAPMQVLQRSRVLVSGDDEVGEIDTASTANSIADAYRSAMDRADALAAAHGVRRVSIWQPDAFTTAPGGRDSTDLSQLGYDDEVRRQIAALHLTVVHLLNGEADDLSDALRDEPLTFIDEVHTNERGAGIVAAAMYRLLRPTLEGLRR